MDLARFSSNPNARFRDEFVAEADRRGICAPSFLREQRSGVLEISDAELHLTRKYQTAADFASGMKKLNR